MASGTAAAAGDDQRRSRSQEGQDASSSSETPDPTPAATFVFEDSQDEGQDNGEAAKSGDEPGFVGRMKEKLGLNPIVLMSMFKGSVAPVICIAMYQAAPVRNLLTTLGYLSAIISILCLVPLPRGKFIQNMLLNMLAMGLGSAMAVLIVWSSVRARLNSSNLAEMEQYIAENGRAPYNSSQSAVCGVWLFFTIWASNTMRAKFPAFNVPVIIFSIFVNISSTFGPEFPTVAQGLAFVKQLLLAMVIGLAVGMGCSLFIFPISTRQIVVKQMAGVLGLFKKAIILEKQYLQGLESCDMFAVEVTETTTGNLEAGRQGSKKDTGPPLTREQKTAMALRGVLAASKELMGKIYADLRFAKRDVAIGHLTPKDFGHLYDLMRGFMIPMTGIGVIMDIFQKVGRERGWDGGAGLGDLDDGVLVGNIIQDAVDKGNSQRIWNDIMQQLHEPFEILSEAILEGADHAGILMKFFPQPAEQKKASSRKRARADAGDDDDVEDSGGDLRPGDVGFSEVVRAKLDVFNSRRGEILRIWAKDKGLLKHGKLEDWNMDKTRIEQRQNDQVQLFVVLYLERLMQATGEAILDFIAFAEEKHRDGSIAKKRIVIPSLRRLRKWLIGVFQDDDSNAEEAPDVQERAGGVVFVGEAWLHKKDPERLPAKSTLERMGNGLRNFSNFFGSAESIFGLRVAVATMCVGVIAFLESTQQFFIQQRIVWALLIITIGMTQTSGQSIFGFFCRVGGTAIAMVNCYIIWYIVDQSLPGVLVFLWLFTFIEYYFFLKFPRFIPMVMITIVTQYLIIGYELQTRALGIAASTASGQIYYPLYELAPYRLATYAAGALVAFFWTIFPKPMTDRTWLRRDLSATMYLLANYSSVIYTTMKTTLTEDLGSVEVRGSPAHSLFKVRRKLYGKLLLLIPSCQAHTNWQKFEPSLGGKFPEEQYQDMIQRCSRMMNYFTLMSYVLTYSSRDTVEESDRAWMRVLSEVLDEVTPIHMQMLSTLTLLSNALMSGQSLPPLVHLPSPYELTRHLLSLTPHDGAGEPAADPHNRAASPWSLISSSPSYNQLRTEPRDKNPQQPKDGGKKAGDPELDAIPEPEAWNLLDARNMEQNGYTEFAVLQVASMLILSEIHGLISTVKSLVGTVDFTFKVEPHDNRSDTSIESVIRAGTWASRADAHASSSKTPKAAGRNGPPGKGKHD